MRIIERLWGSRKFAVRGYSVPEITPNPISSTLMPRQSFLISLYPVATLIPPLLLAIVLRPLSFNFINYLPAGPTPLIFALLAQYHASIPHVYKYRIVTSIVESSRTPPDGILLSDKTITYLLASQLALSQLPGSLLAASVGWGIGVAWRHNILPEKVNDWRLPSWIVGGSKDGEGFEGLRRRLEGEGRASGVEGNAGAEGGRQRRGMGRAILDQFRGSF
ncbi:hypothetical protein MMC19_004463 [Ptychographa xylographoides]|nr:hypothetical protein [Ptychographa xylographoides]